MMRLALGIALQLGGLFNPVSTEAQEAARVARIGFLVADRSPMPYQSFLQGLRDHGYVEGRNVVIEYRSAEGKIERLPALAAELVGLKVDVIVAAVTVAALAAQQATRTIPIVFGAVSDPVATGLVTSFARPGGNITGLSFFTPELVGKSLELLKQAAPGVNRVAVLWQSGGLAARQGEALRKAAEDAARVLGMHIPAIVNARIGAS
jgi:putative ABC transport system substrate-binding protein